MAQYKVYVKIKGKIIQKDDFENLSAPQIKKWCIERGWTYNAKAEKMGGRVLKEYEFFVTQSKKYPATLPATKKNTTRAKKR